MKDKEILFEPFFNICYKYSLRVNWVDNYLLAKSHGSFSTFPFCFQFDENNTTGEYLDDELHRSYEISDQVIICHEWKGRELKVQKRIRWGVSKKFNFSGRGLVLWRRERVTLLGGLRIWVYERLLNEV